MNSRRTILTFLFPIIAMTAASGCGHEEPTLAEADLAPLSVATYEVNLVVDAQPIEVRGVVQPAREATVSFPSPVTVHVTRVSAKSAGP